MLRIFRFNFWPLILFSMLLLVSCNPSGTPPATLTPSPAPREVPGVTLTMLQPGNGDVLALRPNGAYVRFDGSTISTHPRQLRLLVNGVPSGEPFVNSESLITFSRSLTWTPTRAGEYLLQAEADMPDGDIVITPVTRVCVLNLNPDTFAGSIGDGRSYGYLGPCQIPTRIPSAPQTSTVNMSMVTSPELTFRTPNQPTCIGQTAISATFVATVTDPADSIIFVRVLYNFHDNASDFSGFDPGPIITNEVYLNWTTTESGNRKVYRGNTSDLWPMISDIWVRGGITGRGSSIHWMAQGIDRNSEVPLFMSGDIPMRYLNCIPGQLQIGPGSITETPAPLVIIPSDTPTLTPSPTPVEPPTFTLKMNAFCRKGPDMSFPDVTAITKGETVDILNISEDGYWYFVYWKKFDAKCWVAIGTGTANGDTTHLTVLVGPELPEPQPAKPQQDASPTPSKPCIPTAKGCP